MADRPELTFHYIKSPTYDEHPLHGIYGGVTAKGTIAMVAFSERMTIPNAVHAQITQSGQEPDAFELGDERVEGKSGLVRFVHGTYYLDVAMAKAMIRWLTEKVETIEGEKG